MQALRPLEGNIYQKKRRISFIWARLTVERLFANLITDCTNCSPFESDIIVEKAKEVFAIGDHAEGNILQPEQMIWTAIDINEPPGKPLKHCKLKRITSDVHPNKMG